MRSAYNRAHVHIFKRGSQIKKDFHDLIASFVSFVLSFVIESSRCGDVYRVCAQSSEEEKRKSNKFSLWTHLSKSEEQRILSRVFFLSVALEKEECFTVGAWSTDFGLWNSKTIFPDTEVDLNEKFIHRNSIEQRQAPPG